MEKRRQGEPQALRGERWRIALQYGSFIVWSALLIRP
jgi:hypothetical protein